MMDIYISLSQYARHELVGTGLDLLAAYLRTMNERGTSRAEFIRQLGCRAADPVTCQKLAYALKPFLRPSIMDGYEPVAQPRLHFGLDINETDAEQVKQGLDALAHALKTRSGRGISRSALIEQLGMAARHEPHAGQIARVLAPIFVVDLNAPFFS